MLQSWSLHHHASINVEGLSSDVRGSRVYCKELDKSCNLLGLAIPLCSNAKDTSGLAWHLQESHELPSSVFVFVLYEACCCMLTAGPHICTGYVLIVHSEQRAQNMRCAMALLLHQL